mgnify:CR=1 FL=1
MHIFGGNYFKRRGPVRTRGPGDPLPHSRRTSVHSASLGNPLALQPGCLAPRLSGPISSPYIPGKTGSIGDELLNGAVFDTLLALVNSSALAARKMYPHRAFRSVVHWPFFFVPWLGSAKSGGICKPPFCCPMRN